MKRNQIKELPKISNYNYDVIFNTYKTEDGYYYYNMYNSIYIPEDISPLTYDKHIYTEGEFWTKLADQYYGDKRLWWVILVANNIMNPLKLPEPGTILKILKPEAVSEILNQTVNGGSN